MNTLDRNGKRMDQIDYDPYGYFSGPPQYPTYQPIYNQDTQALAPNYQAQLAGINPDQSGLNAYSQSALRSGPSPWAKTAEAKSFQDQAFSNDALAKHSASNVATAQGNLAMHGGTRSGANERLQMAGNNNLLGQQQATAGQGMQNRSQIGINDEQNRIAQLGQLPGMQLQQAQFGLQKAGAGEAARATDIQNQMLAAQSQNAFNMGAYQTQGNIYGARQQAKATEDSGGSWICSEAIRRLGLKYSKDELRALSILKMHGKQVSKTDTAFYLEKGHNLVERMKVGMTFQEWEATYRFIKRVILQVTAGDVHGAFENYEAFTRMLLNRYWPEYYEQREISA